LHQCTANSCSTSPYPSCSFSNARHKLGILNKSKVQRHAVARLSLSQRRYCTILGARTIALGPKHHDGSFGTSEGYEVESHAKLDLGVWWNNRYIVTCFFGVRTIRPARRLLYGSDQCLGHVLLLSADAQSLFLTPVIRASPQNNWSNTISSRRKPPSVQDAIRIAR